MSRTGRIRANVLHITRYNPLKIGKDEVGSNQWRSRLHYWSDIIRADFQAVISRYQRNITNYIFCTADRMLTTCIMKNSKLIQVCFPSKILEVWIARFCVCYDYWRRLQCPQCAAWDALFTMRRYCWNASPRNMDFFISLYQHWEAISISLDFATTYTFVWLCKHEISSL